MEYEKHDDKYTGALGDWMRDERVSSYRLGQLVGVKQSVAYRWAVGQTTPSPKNIALITRVTEGRVNALAFVPELEPENVEEK
jgi:DNA-binding transcriptional regulator YdaS (Cro superfamily)